MWHPTFSSSLFACKYSYPHPYPCTCTCRHKHTGWVGSEWGREGVRDGDREAHTTLSKRERHSLRITLGQSIERIACRQVIAVHQNLSNKIPLFMTSHSAPPLLASAFKLILIPGHLTRLSSMCSLTKPPQAGEPLCTLAQDLLFVDTLGEFISFQCLNII